MSKTNIPVPKFSAEKPYERYKTELNVWSEASDTDKNKHGLLVALSLPEEDESQIRDKVFSEIKMDDLKGAEGFKKLIEYFDSQFAKDDLSETYERYVAFERCKRQSEQKINDFILEYEKKYNLLSKKEGATFTEVILAMKLIDSSNLSDVDRKLVLSGMDYEKKTELFKQSKASLKKFIGEQAIGVKGGESATPAIKLETFISEHEEALVAAGWQRSNFHNQRGRGRSNTLPSGVGGGRQRDESPFRHNRDNSPYNRRNRDFSPKSNPFGRDGSLKRCYECNSTQHMISECPQKQNPKKVDFDVSLFTGNDVNELVLLAHESWDSAILDSACSSNVCGILWIEDLLERLNNELKSLVERTTSNKVFHFGGGEKLTSTGRVKFPCQLAGKNITITTDVVDSVIPLLLSIKSMKKAGMIWDFQKGIVTVFGKEVLLDVSSCGHHSINIVIPEIKIEEFTFIAKLDLNDAELMNKNIYFLHMQFAHPPKKEFVKLLKNGNYWNDKFTETIENIYKSCKTCEVFSKTPSRPVVAMPEAEAFGELVVMDLKSWQKIYLLHMIDAFSRFSISAVIKTKTPQVVAHQFLLKWVGAGYGLCKKIKFDNGGEFSNEEIREVSDCLGMEIKTTGANSPWQNGLCERNHAVTDRCLEKILNCNPNVDLDVALVYACNAKNSLQMWNGYSSYQIVFGTNPKVPDVFNATLPQLEGKTQSEVLAEHNAKC